MTEHRYFKALRGTAPSSRCRAVAAHIFNRYLGRDQSVTKWRKTKPIELSWDSGKGRKRSRIDYEQIVRHMHQHGSLVAEELGLPPIMSPLFDSPVDVGLPIAPVGSDGKTLKVRLPLALGPSFPLTPAVDREGLAIADMQALVENNIASLFRKLVVTSAVAPQPRSGWLTDFRQLVSECVTSVDMMLHKVYLLAEYRGAELGWSFDPESMGVRHGRRIMDKFRWISVVSQRPFSLQPSTQKSFGTLKNLRNHLAHFDPPCFAATLVEVCAWMNCVHDVGDVLWSIRKHLHQQLSESTISILLLPRVEFVGQGAFGRTPPPPDLTVGYASASWRAPDAG